MAGRRVPPARQDDHRAGDLPHRRHRDRVARRHGPRRRARAPRARLLLRARRSSRSALGLLAGNLFKPGAGFSRRRPSADARRGGEGEDRRGRRRRRTALVGFITDDLAADELRRSRSSRTRSSRCSCSRSSTAAAITALAAAAARARRARLRDRARRSSSASSGWSCGRRRSARSAAWRSPSRSSAAARSRTSRCCWRPSGAPRRSSSSSCSASSPRLSGFSILKFIRLLKDELLIILGTSSSETVLPRLLVKLERAGASRQSVGVVLPTGYSFNLDGTCIYLTLGALFIVQATGQDMAIGEQIALAALMVLTSKGAAGHHRRGARDADRVAAGVRRDVLLGRVDRRRHRAGGRHRPRHERGPRADELHRQRRRDDGRSPRWQGELDEERFQAVARRPVARRPRRSSPAEEAPEPRRARSPAARRVPTGRPSRMPGAHLTRDRVAAAPRRAAQLRAWAIAVRTVEPRPPAAAAAARRSSRSPSIVVVGVVVGATDRDRATEQQRERVLSLAETLADVRRGARSAARPTDPSRGPAAPGRARSAAAPDARRSSSS